MSYFLFIGTMVLIFFTSAAGAGELPNQGTNPPGQSATTAAGAIAMQNIPPLYTAPKLPDEGIWVRQDMSEGHDAADLVYRTRYRPSEKFPNAIVYMVVLNMKHLSASLFLGSAEPYGKGIAPRLEAAAHGKLAAVTNALWQTAHAGEGGIIIRGKVLKPMAPGLATIVFYQDGLVDILEWNESIDMSKVQDARQLKHLIVKDGKVITSLVKRGKTLSAEIGLGSLLNEERPVIKVPAATPDGKPTQNLNFTSGDLWFIATRSAFGIRPDGNLVFAVGHHIGTCDLAKALVLAGCVRAIHGDANPGNCVGVLIFSDRQGNILRRDVLSPQQDRSTLDRYLKSSYPKDFVAFFRR
jgi:hypothetical protein